MSGSSKKAIYTAIAANSAVTIAKFAAFAVSGSGTMFAEGIHSLADVGNQSLLALGLSRAERPADENHPEGYGQEAFVWSLISAVGIFFLGCGVTVMHGISSLTSGHHQEITAPGLIVGVLLFSLVVEGGSLMVAVKLISAEAKQRGLTFRQHITTTSDPFGVAVLLEDCAAVFGVLLALAMMGLTIVTHQPEWDAIGSIAIGVLLGSVAVFLIRKNSSMLIGQAISKTESDLIHKVLEEALLVESVHKERFVVTGNQSLRVSAEIDIDGRHIAQLILSDKDIVALHKELTTPTLLEEWLVEFGELVATRLGIEIDHLEEELRKAVPNAKSVDLEPD